MSLPVFFISAIEILLIVLTALFLLQPKFVFRAHSPKGRGIIWIGVIFLGFTFCWSVILGIILAMNDISLRI